MTPPTARIQRISPRFTRPLLGAAVALAAAPAGAQDIAAAEALFNRGLADMEAGRYETGCPALAESQRLDPRPGTLFTLATCESRWGRVATAVTRYRDYLATFRALPPDRRAQQGQRPKLADAELEKLAPDVPELTLTLPPGAAPGTVVKRDGEVVAEAALGIPLPVDPGEHEIATEAPGGAAWRQRITIARGEKKAVALEVRAAPAATPKGSDTGPGLRSGPSGRRVATYALGGAGVVGIVVGGVLGGMALGQKDVFEKHCGAGLGLPDETACDPTGLDAVASARALGIGSTVGLAVGVAAVGAAAVLLFTEPAPRRAAAAPPRWISAGVAPLGPAGAAATLQGAW